MLFTTHICFDIVEKFLKSFHSFVILDRQYGEIYEFSLRDDCQRRGGGGICRSQFLKFVGVWKEIPPNSH
jgi:hypothetical protein